MKKIMMKLEAGRLVLTIFFCCAMTMMVLTACSDKNDNPTPSEEQTSAVDNGVWLVTPEVMDPSYRLGDDFYMYCTGGFWKTTTVDESKRDINLGIMSEAGELMKQRVAALNIPARTKLKDDLGKMDDASVTLMKQTIQNAVNRLQAVTTKEELWHLVGQLIKEGYKMPFDLHLFSSHGRIATVLNLGSESDFSNVLISDDNKHDLQWRLLNDPALLACLQPLHSVGRRAFNHDAWPMYTGIIEGLGIDLKDVYSVDASPLIMDGYKKILIDGLTEMQNMSLDELKTSLTESVTSDAVLYDDNALAEINEASGTANTRTDLIDQFFEANMRYTIARAFAEAYVTPAMKQQTRELCEELHKSFRQRITANQWMSAGSKQNATDKLDAMVFNIGCPDEWFEEGLPELTNEPTVLHDVMAARRANVQLSKRLIGMDTPRASFHMLLYKTYIISTVNACYVQNFNTMNIFPVWMMEPFKDETLNEAHNYVIFSVCGHEITHGFDTNGAGYNKIGDLGDIWASDADKQEFLRRAKMLEECYSGFEVMPWSLPGLHNDGAYTLAENIADLGGFLIAYDTYVRHLRDIGFTGDQFDLQRRRFYLAYAWLWHAKYSAMWAHDRTVDPDARDVHSLARERVNGVCSNTDDWYNLFDVKEGDKLFRKVDERVRIW